jgi:hypothetical protein
MGDPGALISKLLAARNSSSMKTATVQTPAALSRVTEIVSQAM